MTLHIFNPETDYALASDSVAYTAPARVEALRHRLAFLPALYGSPGDLILLPRGEEACSPLGNLPFSALAKARGIKGISPEELSRYSDKIDRVNPWGWNRALRHMLVSYGLKTNAIPSQSDLDRTREISHRRTTTKFFDYASGHFPEILLPVEVQSVDDALNYMGLHGNVCFKAPWSSSGRGIIFTSELELRHIEPWLRGVIRTQGSVMAEKTYDKHHDLASEWMVDNEGIRFTGLAMFEASSRGKYHFNFLLDDDEIMQKCGIGKNEMNSILEIQRAFLNDYVRPRYSGPVGIDMLTDHNGTINPCVEFNFRNTMGMVAAEVARRMRSEDSDARLLKFLFPKNILEIK